MAFERGSLILVEYAARLDDGTVIEAANHGGDPPEGVRNFSSKPKLVSVGDPSYPVLRGFDRALADAEVNAPQTVTIQPADAYGERRRDKVKMITARKLGKDADRYTVGDTVEVNNSTGVILSMGSGRVRVDFNHIFAGKSITYEFTVLKQLESDTDKIEGLLAQAGLLEDYDPLHGSGNDLDAPDEGEDPTDGNPDASKDDPDGEDPDAPDEGEDPTDGTRTPGRPRLRTRTRPTRAKTPPTTWTSSMTWTTTRMMRTIWTTRPRTARPPPATPWQTAP